MFARVRKTFEFTPSTSDAKSASLFLAFIKRRVKSFAVSGPRNRCFHFRDSATLARYTKLVSARNSRVARSSRTRSSFETPLLFSRFPVAARGCASRALRLTVNFFLRSGRSAAVFVAPATWKENRDRKINEFDFTGRFEGRWSSVRDFVDSIHGRRLRYRDRPDLKFA